MQAVRTEKIIKEFPSGDEDIRVLHGIDMALETGALSMLVGPSGCGKTTLLSIVTGILSPTSGKVWVAGEEITRLRGRSKVEFRRKHMGFIFQQYNLLPALTAAENAAVPLVASGMGLEEASEKAAELLGELGMQAHVNKLPNQLSGGQQQRVAIARALVHKPKLIVCDEPTAALDAHTGQKVMQMLRDAALDANRAVLVVTHDNRIYHYADRIIHMSDGRITHESHHQGAEDVST